MYLSFSHQFFSLTENIFLINHKLSNFALKNKNKFLVNSAVRTRGAMSEPITLHAVFGLSDA